jgi:hypothetical protein
LSAANRKQLVGRFARAALGCLGILSCAAVDAQGFVDSIADAWLEEGDPLSNHGTDTELSAMTAPGASLRALYRFDLSGLAPNANVTEALAWFRVTDVDATGLPIDIFAVTDTWSEGTVNWSNTGNDYDASSVHGSFVADATGWSTVDITPLVQSWVCGEIDDHGIMLIPQSSNTESRFTSREYAVQGIRSRLRVTVSGTNPCADGVDHFVVTHDTFGIHCLAETVTVRAEDATDNPVTTYTETVTLDTQTGRGTWVLVSGGGTFADAAADDGMATYQWADGESEATFSLTYLGGAVPVDIDVYQTDNPTLRDTDAEGPMTFSANGFTLTALPLGNPPPALVVPFAQAQTAAIPFDVHIAAYGQTDNDPECGIIETYSGSKNLSFWSTYLNPGTGSRSVTIDGTMVATTETGASTQVVTFVNGQAVVSARYKDVGSLQIAVKDETGVNPELPLGIRGATAGFVSKPARFELSAIENAAGTIVNPAAGDAFGAVFIAAGAGFRATVTALDAEDDATPNYGRESVAETVRLDVNLMAPAGGSSPGIGWTTGFGAFSGGTATGTDFYWPEVGIIRLVPGVGDADYLGAGDVVGVESENVGRFVPDHFGLALNVPFLGTQCVAGGFTYAGDGFSYAVQPTITATAEAADNSPTLNYTGDFFKMTTASLANRAYTSASGLLDTSGVPSATADPTVAETGPGVATLVFSSGSGLSFDRSSMPAPFDAEIELAIDVLDSDNVAALTNPAVFGSSGGIAFSDGAGIRYGRLRFGNALGSELVDLPVPLVAEYFAGPAIGFVTNPGDSCTTDVELSLGDFTENLASGETCVLDSGAPGASGAGCPSPAPLSAQFAEPPVAGDFNLTLAAPGATNHGSVRIDSIVPAWLRFDWDQAVPGDENPSGHATFGLYDGDSAQIYLREVY